MSDDAEPVLRFVDGETRLVPMVEVLDTKKGEVARYHYPRGYNVERWWDAGISPERLIQLRDEANAAADHAIWHEAIETYGEHLSRIAYQRGRAAAFDQIRGELDD
jgi:hypothetical protein